MFTFVEYGFFSVAIAPMVTTAKGAITQSGNAAAQEQFSAKADNVRILVQC